MKSHQGWAEALNITLFPWEDRNMGVGAAGGFGVINSRWESPSSKVGSGAMSANEKQRVGPPGTQ